MMGINEGDGRETLAGDCRINVCKLDGLGGGGLPAGNQAELRADQDRRAMLQPLTLSPLRSALLWALSSR